MHALPEIVSPTPVAGGAEYPLQGYPLRGYREIGEKHGGSAVGKAWYEREEILHESPGTEVEIGGIHVRKEISIV